MKELYNEYFHVPKQGKVREKVMLVRTAVTVIVMIVCLLAMSFTAYAYFSCNVTSGSNIIKAAHFEVQITVTDGTNNIVLTTEGKYQVAALKTGKEYSVTLAAPAADGSAETGFCVITDRYQSKIYHTQQLGVDENVSEKYTGSITFSLTVSEDVDVFFLSHWGTSSSYDPYSTNKNDTELYVCDKDEVSISVVDSASGVSNTTGEKDEPSSETTSQETTTGETTESTTTPTEVVYTVQSGDTLSGIAKQYNTTVAKIAAYNGIPDPSKIVTGQKITIPPADHEIPTDTTTEPTTSSETITSTKTSSSTEPESTTSVPGETQPTETTGTTETTESTEPVETEPTNAETQPTTESTEPETTGTESVGETTE